jgi:dTDP-4-dehydrorhamnose reductase
VGRPTWTVTLARITAELLRRRARGIFHASDGGEPVSWYGFAREIVAQVGSPAVVLPVASGHYPRPARRPSYSVLECSATEQEVGWTLPSWRDALAEYLASRNGPKMKG